MSQAPLIPFSGPQSQLYQSVEKNGWGLTLLGGLTGTADSVIGAPGRAIIKGDSYALGQAYGSLALAAATDGAWRWLGVGETGIVPNTFGAIPERITTSRGIPIEPSPGQTTTILGSYRADMQNIIENQLNYPKTSDFGPKPSGFNVLNVDTPLKGDAFWDQYNQPFLDSAITRGDPIRLATPPEDNFLYRSDGSLTGYGREIQYLSGKGYYFDPVSHSMVKR